MLNNTEKGFIDAHPRLASELNKRAYGTYAERALVSLSGLDMTACSGPPLKVLLGNKSVSG